MAAVDHSKSPRSARKSARLAVSPDLSALLGRFSDARAVIEVACRAQETGERYTEETTALRVGLTMLDSAYDELDRAIDLLAGVARQEPRPRVRRPTERARSH